MPAWTGLPRPVHPHQNSQARVQSLEPGRKAWAHRLCCGDGHHCHGDRCILDHRFVCGSEMMNYAREPGFKPATKWQPTFQAPILASPVTSFAVLRYLQENPGAKTTTQIAWAMNACTPATGARLGYLFDQGLVGRTQRYSKLKRAKYF